MDEVFVEMSDPKYQFSALRNTDPFDGPVGWLIEDPERRYVDLQADLLQYVPEELERHTSIGAKIRATVRAFIAEIINGTDDALHRLNGGV